MVHSLWKVDISENDFFQHEFGKIPCTYVADGHHRSAAAYNVGKKRMLRALDKGLKITGIEDFNHFMTIVYPSDNLRIMDYNRVFKDANGLSEFAFISGMRESFIVTEAKPYTKPLKKHQMTLLLFGKWYNCEVKPSVIEEVRMQPNS